MRTLEHANSGTSGQTKMSAQDIIVVGGSAGALEPLTQVVSRLPGSFQGHVFVALHTSPQSGGALPQILQRSTTLPVSFAIDGEKIAQGRIYVAPPDHHLILEDSMMSVARGPRENGFRPAIDPLFRSAAKEHKARVVGVVLSGAMDDGTFGLMAVKEAGGAAIVQHPYEAFIPSMPLSAIQNVEVDHIVRAEEIPQLLMKAVAEGLTPKSKVPESALKKGTDPTQRDISLKAVPPDEMGGPPSKFVCPECGGPLWQVEEARLTRYRCFTGHGFTANTLLAAQNGKLEHALWSAVRVLMERAALHRELAERLSIRGMNATAERYQEQARQQDKHANVIREMLSAAPALGD
jgi:two-component system chemotaxis response regulator CheB